MALVLKAKVFLNTVGSNPTLPEIIFFIINIFYLIYYIAMVVGKEVCAISTKIKR